MRQDIRTPVRENRDPTSHRSLTFGARQCLRRNGLVSVTGNVYRELLVYMALSIALSVWSTHYIFL